MYARVFWLGMILLDDVRGGVDGNVGFSDSLAKFEVKVVASGNSRTSRNEDVSAFSNSLSDRKVGCVASVSVHGLPETESSRSEFGVANQDIMSVAVCIVAFSDYLAFASNRNLKLSTEVNSVVKCAGPRGGSLARSIRRRNVNLTGCGTRNFHAKRIHQLPDTIDDSRSKVRICHKCNSRRRASSDCGIDSRSCRSI